MQCNPVTAAMRGLRKVIDLEGDDRYSDNDLHPDAVLVTFDGVTRSCVVLDPTGNGKPVDRDEAISAAEDYMREMSLLSPGQRHSYVFELCESDAPRFIKPEKRDAIVKKIEDVRLEQAARSAAKELSLEHPSFGADAVIVVEAEVAFAVNGEAEVAEPWASRLALSSEIGSPWKEGHICRLRAWLEEKGYSEDEEVDQPPQCEYGTVDWEEIEIAVATELNVSREKVQAVVGSDLDANAEFPVYDAKRWLYQPRRYAAFVFTLDRMGGGRHDRLKVAVTAADAEQAHGALADAVLDGPREIWGGVVQAPGRKGMDRFVGTFPQPNGSISTCFLSVAAEQCFHDVEDPEFLSLAASSVATIQVCQKSD